MRIAIAVLALVVVPVSALSSFEHLWSVAAVIRVDESFQIEQVPVIEFFDRPSCTMRTVWLTTAPGFVAVEGKPQNRNAANLLGARAKLESPHGSMADTLLVQLDVTAIDEQVDQDGYRILPAEEIIPLTVECLRRNVRACSYPESRYVTIAVAGDPRFESFGGTFALSGLHN